MVLFLANVISDCGDSSLQMMTWPERERDRWWRFLSTKNQPVDMMAFAKLHWLLDVPDPVMPTKEEMERKYKRQARYEREKENFWFFTTAISDELFLFNLERVLANLWLSNWAWHNYLLTSRKYSI